MPKVDLRGLQMTTEGTARVGYVESPTFELTEDADELLAIMLEHPNSSFTEADLEDLRQELRWTPGRLEAAILAGIWAGELRRD